MGTGVRGAVGALVVATIVAAPGGVAGADDDSATTGQPLSVPGAAGAVQVGDEASLRAAFEHPEVSEIVVTADGALTGIDPEGVRCGLGSLTRRSRADLLISSDDAGPYRITQTCDGERVMTAGQ